MSGKELRRAAQKNNVEDVTSLLSQGVEIDAVDSDENTALLLAAERGSVEACSVLLHHGANIVAKNNEGRTATELAREFNKTTLVPLLEAAEQIRNLKLENGKLANSLASSEENLSAMIGKYEGACAELKAQQKAEKKLRADVARCASATMQLVGHVGKEESNSGE